jgi:type IV pilus assembly protein PilC
MAGLNLVLVPRRRVPYQSVLEMTSQLAMMFKTGIPLARGLQILSEQCVHPGMKDVLEALYIEVCRGRLLSDAMARMPSVFPVYYTRLVHVGELYGDIGATLDLLVVYIEDDMRLRRAVKSAMTYPVQVAGTTGIFLLFVFYFILPQFVQIFESLRIPLPLATRILIDVVWILNNPIPLCIAGVVVAALVHVGRAALATDEGMMRWNRFKLRLPMLGNLTRRVALARLARSLSLMLGGGVHLLDALEAAGQVAGNEAYRVACDECISYVRQGRMLAEYFYENPQLFTTSFSQMVDAGTEAGRIQECLLYLARIYEMDVYYTLQSFQTALEPILIGISGLVVGFILVAVLLPLYTYSSQLVS